MTHSYIFSRYFYIILLLVGYHLAYLYGRHTKKFLWREYIALLVAPTVIFILVAVSNGIKAVYVFASGCLLGMPLEHMLGFAYKKIMGAHLWVYERYPTPGQFTSYLTIPIWGFAFVLVWFITRNL